MRYGKSFFDRQIDRSGTEATKWSRFDDLGFGEDDSIPLWLADMDLSTSEEITRALVNRAGHPIYGYTDRSPEYQRLFAERFASSHREIGVGDVVLSTGVMYSIAGALELFTEMGDGVLIPRPCYHPFVATTEALDRRPVFVDMVQGERGFGFDFEDMDRAAAHCRAIILCNPHNPTGRIFTKDELEALSEICERHHLIVISDEIHSDFVYGGTSFTSISAVSRYVREHGVFCVAPTKAFNLAGIKVSAAIIFNPEMNSRFADRARTVGINSINLFAMEALKAAYTQSEEWQESLLRYLEANRKVVADFINENEGFVHAFRPDGTYFYWLHFPGIEDVSIRLAHEARVVLNAGIDFSPLCGEWARLNFACPQSVLVHALNRIALWRKEQLGT